MSGTLKLVSPRLINEKSALFSLYSSSLSALVPWWLSSYIYVRKEDLVVYHL